jgi:uncharacterized protein (TIGR03437 family)
MKTASVALGFLLLSSAAVAQQYVISTVAGGAPPRTPIAGVSAQIGQPSGIATDAAGNVYFTSLRCVFRLDQNGVLTRVAGNSRGGFSGDGGPAIDAQLFTPRGPEYFVPKGLAVDAAGALYIADDGSNRVRKVSPAGIITTVAGGGTGSPGAGGAATSTMLSYPLGLAIDSVGNLYVADHDSSRVQQISPGGIVTTVAGNGTLGYSGDGGSATSAQLNEPIGVAIDNAGNLYIAERGNSTIRRVSPAGIITTVAGNGTRGVSGDGGSATSAQLGVPVGVATDNAGNLYIADNSGPPRIRKVSPTGIITTIAGGDTGGLIDPRGVAVDNAGNLYVPDYGAGRVLKVSPSGTITTVAGNGPCCGSSDGGPATTAQLHYPSYLAMDAAGNLYIADSSVYKVSPVGVITTVAGANLGSFGDGVPATGAVLSAAGLAVDNVGNLYIADTSTSRIRKVSPSGIINTLAGNSTFGYSGDGGPAISAQLNYPAGLAGDSVGNLYVADSGNGRVRKVSPTGIITTVAGNGTCCNSLGDGGPATSAQLNGPVSVAIDGTGNLYIADSGNYRVRKVSPTGIITTVAGNGTCCGNFGDGGPATSAQLDVPESVAVDSTGNLYIADSGNYRVRKVSRSGEITTIAGNGVGAYSGDGGPATNAQLYQPMGLTVDGAENVYVADYRNSAVRLLQPTNQSVLASVVLDAASESAAPTSPGKIVVIYGGGLGPSVLAQYQINNGVLANQLAGTTVSFNGVAAPILYTSATQVAAIVPYGLTGTTAQVAVTYQGQASTPLAVPVAASAPSMFTLNQTGAGQAAAINAVDGTINTAVNPVKIRGYISLFATGEGQTTPAGVDGKIASGLLLPQPSLKVSVTVGGIPALVQYAGAAPNEVAGVMQVNVQIPAGVQPGGYVPVVLQVGNASTTPGAVWIAVAN